MTVRLEVLEGFESAPSKFDLMQMGWRGTAFSYTLTTPTTNVRSGNRSLYTPNATIGMFTPRLSVNARSVVLGYGFFSDHADGPQSITLVTLSADASVGSPYNASSSQLIFRYSASSQRIMVYRGYSTTSTASIDGTLLGSGSMPLVQGGYNYLEVRAFIDSTNGYVQVLFNGLEILELIDVNTQYLSGKNYVNDVSYSSHVPNSSYYDDFYTFSDDSPTLTTQECIGDAKILPSVVNADGAYSQLTPSAGTTHSENVDEIPFSNTDYNGSITPGLKDTYQFADIVGYPQIFGVKAIVSCIKSDAGFRACKAVCRSGASELIGSAKPVGIGGAIISTIYDVDPNTGVKWTLSALNAGEFGAEVV